MTADQRRTVREARDARMRERLHRVRKAEREIDRSLEAAEKAGWLHCGLCGAARCVCGIGDYIYGFDRDGRISYPAGVRPSQEVPV